MKNILTLQNAFRRFQPEIAAVAKWLLMLSILAGILLTREVTCGKASIGNEQGST